MIWRVLLPSYPKASISGAFWLTVVLQLPSTLLSTADHFHYTAAEGQEVLPSYHGEETRTARTHQGQQGPWQRELMHAEQTQFWDPAQGPVRAISLGRHKVRMFLLTLSTHFATSWELSWFGRPM